MTLVTKPQLGNELLRHFRFQRLLAFLDRYEFAFDVACIDLPRAADLLARGVLHFLPMGDPARQAADGEQYREHLHRMPIAR